MLSRKLLLLIEFSFIVSFTFGDYVVKSLIGSIDPDLDSLDEPNGCRLL